MNVQLCNLLAFLEAQQLAIAVDNIDNNQNDTAQGTCDRLESKER